MWKFLIAGGIMCVIGLILTIVLGVYVVGVANSETSLHNLITAKQTDNTQEYDNMWKKISQDSQVTEAQKNAIKDIVVGYADARHSGGGALATSVQEVVPNMDTTTFNKLMDSINSSRDRWTMQQKELISLKNQDDNLIDLFPSNLVCSVLGRHKIDIKVVTSTRTENSFQTGKDDDTQLFHDNTNTERK